ncbi:MAG: N-acetylmuramoyl-L-alanine amidase [Bacillota bacterium]|nr:N-acetylmuramoyl-L-alanine amidase [Bacillota bacterium]
MDLRLSNKDRKKTSLYLASFALIILIILALAISFKNDSAHNKSGTVSAADVLINEKNVVKVAKDKDGNIYMEENKLFKKYTIKVSSAIKNINYKQDDNAVLISFDKDVPLKLNSEINDTNSKYIYMTNDNGKNNLKFKKSYKDNNFVYINSGKDSNEIIVLVSKVKKPFTHKAVLNPGHGGIDSGQSVGNLYEKDITLRIVKLMVSDLQYNGVDVVLTRDKDEGQALADIAAFVNKIQPDVFLSVHINGMDENPNNYQGIGVYYYDENGYQTNERIKLANMVLKHATMSDGWKNDGVVRDKLKVIRLSKAPAVLVETGFLTNDSDRARLQNDKVLGNLANNLSQALVEYVNEK